MAFDGKKMANRRVELGLRREHLAVAVGRSMSAIASYEHGRVDPPASVVAALATALDLAPGDLFAEPAAS